jgi:hypothetical protein
MRKETLKLIIRHLEGVVKAKKKEDCISNLKAIVTVLKKEVTQEKLT